MGTPIPACFPSTTTTLPEVPLCGDANDDGFVTTPDALDALRAAVNIGSCSLERCDYNGDGKVTTADALEILRVSVHLPSTPKCPAPQGFDVPDTMDVTTTIDVTTTTLPEPLP